MHTANIAHQRQNSSECAVHISTHKKCVKWSSTDAKRCKQNHADVPRV